VSDATLKLAELEVEARKLCDDFNQDVTGYAEFQSGMLNLVGPLLGLAKYQDAEIARLTEKLNANKCNRGHETLPLVLWDCPACTEEIRREIQRLRIALEQQPCRCNLAYSSSGLPAAIICSRCSALSLAALQRHPGPGEITYLDPNDPEGT